MTPPKPDAATSTNAACFRAWSPKNSVFQLRFFGPDFDLATAAGLPSVDRTLRTLTSMLCWRANNYEKNEFAKVGLAGRCDSIFCRMRNA